MMLGLGAWSAGSKTPTQAAEVVVITIPALRLFLIVLFAIVADDVSTTTIPLRLLFWIVLFVILAEELRSTLPPLATNTV